MIASSACSPDRNFMIHVDIFSRELTKRQGSVPGYYEGAALATDKHG